MKKKEVKMNMGKDKINIPTKKELLDMFFGKFKEFGNGLEYQKMIRHGK